jgi:aminoglycoside phosphotransferase (APT) family kinase protein
MPVYALDARRASHKFNQKARPGDAYGRVLGMKMNTKTPPADELIAPLALWLQSKMPGATSVALHDIIEPAAGFSNKTVLFCATWMQDGALHEQKMVARIARETDCPMLADIFLQWRVMEAVAANSDVRVPQLLFAEPDPSVIGSPFFLMKHVEGRTTPDFPTHHAAGWFKDELTPQQRNRAWWNSVTEMSRLHQIDWRAFSFLGATEAPSVEFYLNHFVGRWYEWGSQGRDHPMIQEGMRRLINDRPPETGGLVWSDARPGNTMFAKDLSVAALVDFEAVSMGPPEIDAVQFLYMEDIYSDLRGAKRLEGVPNREELIQGFERVYGRPLNNFDYYDALAALRHAVIFLRSYGNGKETGAVDSVDMEYALNRLSRYLSS